VWGVLAIGGIIAFLAIVHQGTIKEGQFIGLLVFLVAGSLFPPAAIGIGLIIVIAMIYRGAGTQLGDWLSGQVGRSAGAATVGTPFVPVVQPVTIASGYNPFPPATNVININQPVNQA